MIYLLSVKNKIKQLKERLKRKAKRNTGGRGVYICKVTIKLKSCKIFTKWLIGNSGPSKRIKVKLPELDVKI
jgi:hypothetical protein